jgi:hypothetical protein
MSAGFTLPLRPTVPGWLAAAGALGLAVAPAAAQPPGATTPQPDPPSSRAVYVEQAAGPKTGAQTPPPKPSRNEGPQGFSVVLVVGDLQGTDATDNVPAAARRALADMKDFLPYKSYRLLDAQWVLCCSGTGAATIRLRGAEDQDYELDIRSHPEGSSGLNVRFNLRQHGDAVTRAEASESEAARELAARGLVPQGSGEARRADVAREVFTLERERVDLEAELAKARQQVEVGMRDKADLQRLEAQRAAVAERILRLERDVESPARRRSEAQSVINTSFRMDIGETVVVGTSRMKGASRALIALLTAVPQRSRAR